MRVISRITDSGNFWTRSESRGSSIARSARPPPPVGAMRLLSGAGRKRPAKTCRTSIKNADCHPRRGPPHVRAVLRFLARRCVHGHAHDREPSRRLPPRDRTLAHGDARGRPRDEPLGDDFRLLSEQSVGELSESHLHSGRRNPVCGPPVDRDRVRRGPRGARPASRWILDHLSGIGDRRPTPRTDLRGRSGQESDHDPGRALPGGGAEKHGATGGGPRGPRARYRPEGPRAAGDRDGHSVAAGADADPRGGARTRPGPAGVEGRHVQVRGEDRVLRVRPRGDGPRRRGARPRVRPGSRARGPGDRECRGRLRRLPRRAWQAARADLHCGTGNGDSPRESNRGDRRDGGRPAQGDPRRGAVRADHPRPAPTALMPRLRYGTPMAAGAVQLIYDFSGLLAFGPGLLAYVPALHHAETGAGLRIRRRDTPEVWPIWAAEALWALAFVVVLPYAVPAFEIVYVVSGLIGWTVGIRAVVRDL